MNVTSTRIQTDLLLSWAYNATEDGEKDKNTCWHSNGKKQTKKVTINATSLSSAIRTEAQRSASQCIASIVALENQIKYGMFPTCGQWGLSSNIASYSVKSPQITPLKFEIICKDLPRYLARVTKFRPASCQFGFLLNFAAKSQRTDAKYSLYWNRPSAVQLGHAHHNTTLAFSDLIRWKLNSWHLR